MKHALAILGALAVMAYFAIQAILTALQPLFNALSSHAH